MSTHTQRWIATVDDRRARLFRGAKMPGGTWQFEEVEESLVNEWEDSHERGRPAMLGMRGPAGQSRHATPGREEEESRHRFAAHISRWLEKRADKFGPIPLVLFAAPKMVGELRNQSASSNANPVRLINAELSRLRPGELGDHPTVLEALQDEE